MWCFDPSSYIYIYKLIWKHHYYCCTCYREVPRKLHYAKKQANVKVHFEGGDPVSLIYDLNYIYIHIYIYYYIYKPIHGELGVFQIVTGSLIDQSKTIQTCQWTQNQFISQVQQPHANPHWRHMAYISFTINSFSNIPTFEDHFVTFHSSLKIIDSKLNCADPQFQSRLYIRWVISKNAWSTSN